MPAQTPFELLAEELGIVAGRIERETGLRFSALLANIEKRFTEYELQIERLQKSVDVLMAGNLARWDKMIADRISSLRDGVDGKDGRDGTNGSDGAPGKDGINGIDGKDGQNGIDGKDGIDGAPGPVGPQGAEGLQGLPGAQGEVGPAGKDGLEGPQGVAGPEGPRGERGEKGMTGEAGVGFAGPAGKDGAAGKDGTNGKDGERGPEGPPGKLPKVKKWIAGVHYEGDVCTHPAGLFQALKDTAHEPSQESNHWICLAASGVAGKDGCDGEDGKSLTIRETYDPKEMYKALDVVTLDSKWFVAKHDNPGVCPGPGWKAGPGIGKTGRPGERGLRGETGPKGADGRAFEITRWEIVPERFEATPVMTDGSHGPTIQLRELFVRYQEEVG